MRSVALSTKGVESEKDLSNDSIQKCAIIIQKITLTYDYLDLLQIDLRGHWMNCSALSFSFVCSSIFRNVYLMNADLLIVNSS